MKKNLIVLGLIAMLGLGLPASAMPHDRGGHGGPCGRPMPAPVQVAPPHHCSHHYGRPAVGVSFSTGVLARRNCWCPYYYYDAMSFYPRYIDYPSVFINLGF